MASYAVSVKNVVKHYGNHVVFNGISMNVERGTIYGLLGASGCGKTTLLSSILGRKTIEAGEIWLFGRKLGKNQSGIPCSKIGYMPQEIALIQEFTIRDTIYYFGRIYNMTYKEIKERFEALHALLELPPKERFLKHCSGGQQRRVSFAVALLHKPELLILDEPTVGLDPLLRERIWNYLRDLVQIDKVSVIITTHYIEECKDADKIGLMRNGKLLAEESPAKLLTHYHTDTLEEVFLELSKAQEEYNRTHIDTDAAKYESPPISAAPSFETCAEDYGSRDVIVPTTKGKGKEKKKDVGSSSNFNIHRMHALFNKNWKQFYRNIGGILFLISFPILQLWFFVNSVGTNPINLNVGIVNKENSTSCRDSNWNTTVLVDKFDECHFKHISCQWMGYLDDPMINKVPYDTVAEAMQDVKHGKLVGFIHIPHNFSGAYEERIRLGQGAEKSSYNFGEIKVYLDMSNRQIGIMLQQKLIERFVQFQEDVLIHCNISTKLVEFPFKIHFYNGHNDEPMTVFMAPGIVVLLSFLLGSTMTSQILVKERLDGIWDRSVIAGVSSLEITLSHLLFQAAVMIIQCVESILMLFFILQISYAGNIGTMYLICYISGVCGMAYGFCGSAICRTHSEANIFCTGGYLPMTMICGVIWPIEGMPPVLRIIAVILPCTKSIQSFRNVMKKGWSLWNTDVLDGIGVNLLWIFVFAIMSIWFIKRNK
ncbi:ABC transporter G family member 23-like [Rhynchophorus ferrugineus]|uniref:ABC transporter G family member 23-like n=1 Tax=Rhynchophorus ferrugineus TaxID=354439 RepID=UPI003FCD5C6F